MEHVFSDANFTQDVLNSPVPVLVDFWAEWCGPCRMMGPIVEELAEEMDGSKIKIGKMNVDENPQTPGSFGIMSIPTFLLFKNGTVVEQLVGAMSKETMKEKLNRHI